MADQKVEETSQRDRISELPAPIRQQILSLLPTKQAATTSIFSTSWRYEWLNLPCIDITPQSFNMTTLNSLQYLQILDHVLQIRKLHGGSGIRNLSLGLPHMNASIHDLGSSLVDQWLCFVTEGGKLEEMTFHGNIHAIDRNIFSSLLGYIIASSITITKLDLRGCHISNDEKSKDLVTFCFPFLRELSLNRVLIGNGITLENLLANCPSLEKLRLDGLHGHGNLKLVRVFGLPKLKELEVENNFGLERVEIDASNLHRLSICGDWDVRCAIQVTPSCRKLVDLQLSYSKINDNELNQLLDQVLQLECLKLFECHKLENIRIGSNSLVSLSIMRCRRLGRVELVDPPLYKLKSFVYHIEKTIMSLHSTTPVAAMYTEVRLPYVELEHAECCRLEREHVLWHAKIVALLGKLSYSKHVSLFMNSQEKAIIPRRLRQSACPHPLHGNQHLELSLEYLQTSHDLIQCLDSLLWLSPRPNFIRISRRSHNKPLNILIELLYKEESEKGKSCICYPDQRINCWRHSLKGFKIREQQGFEEDDESLTRFFSGCYKMCF